MKSKFLAYCSSIIVFLLCSSTSYGQFEKEDFVEKDPRVNILIQKQIELNRNEVMRRTYVVQGYRIQVMSSNNREMVLKAKSDLLKFYPNEQSYLLYQSPNFRLLFGNYPTYNEAKSIKAELESFFGNTVLIVPSKIEVKGIQLIDEKKQ